jgi:hypothetical protein
MQVSSLQHEPLWKGIAIRYELHMLGALIDGPMWMFGDNKSMIDSASEPAGRLQKRHLILSWHHLREKAAMGIVVYVHIKSQDNTADCLTKHLSHGPLWALIKDKLFYRHASGSKIVEVMVNTSENDQALDREYQDGNEVIPELIIPLDDLWIRAPIEYLQCDSIGSSGGRNEAGSFLAEVK